MKKKTLSPKVFLFILLGVVIVCAVALPAALSRFGERKLLGAVGEAGLSRTEQPEPVSTLQKLLLILDNSTGSRQITLTEQRNITASGGENAVLSSAVYELEKLSNAGLLPALPSDSPASGLSCTAATYTDPEDTNLRVTVWKLEFSADGHDICVWMDTETKLVYCISFTNPRFGLSTAIAENISAAWGNYIGLEPGTPVITGESFSTAYEEVSFDFIGKRDVLCIRLSDSGFMN